MSTDHSELPTMDADDDDDPEDLMIHQASSHNSNNNNLDDNLDDADRTNFAIAGYAIKLENTLLPYIGQLLAAVVLFIALVTPPQGEEGLNNKGYGLAVCIVVFLFGTTAIVLCRFNTYFDMPLGDLPFVGPLSVGRVLAGFLYIWWFIGASILTFNGPFNVTSNGYFSAWGGVLCAALALVRRDQIQDGVSNIGTANWFTIAAIVQILSLPSFLAKSEGYFAESLYALLIAILSLVGLVFFRQCAGNMTGGGGTEDGSTASSTGVSAYGRFEFPFYVVFAVLWLVLACLTTFRGPFLETGNGYFSAWAGFGFCATLAASKHGGVTSV